MKNCSGAKKSNPLNDVRGDASTIANAGIGNDVRKDRKQRRTHADEHVGADACALATNRPLQADQSTENRREQQARDARGQKHHVLPLRLGHVRQRLHGRIAILAKALARELEGWR